MKNKEKTLQTIRRAEEALFYATPKQAAALTRKIVRLKGELFG
jgi:hypothetical protein